MGLVVTGLLGAFWNVGAIGARAASANDPAILREARYQLDAARAGSPGALNLCRDLLMAENGNGEEEVLADLARTPPDYLDAATRVDAQLAAIASAPTPEDPAAAKAALDHVLADPRFHAAAVSDNPIDRLRDYLLQRLLGLLFTHGSLDILKLAVFLALVAGLVAIAVLALRQPLRSGAQIHHATGDRPRRHPQDHFAAADRAAAAADYATAVRELVAALVAIRGGEPTWEGSHLTVRELFDRGGLADLATVVAAFERVTYGHREATAADWEAARKEAAPYRELPLAA
ncbi:MAG: hypothetical protein ACYDGR_05945 [Candidatus Dormibacteria bacterium]